MTLLELCLSPDFGGLEIFFRDYARWLAARPGVRLHLCVQAGSRLAQELAPLQRPTLAFDSKAGPLPLSAARRLTGFVKQHNVDVVHVHWKDDLPLAALSKSMGRGVKLVHSRHMDLPGAKKDPYHRYLYRSIDCFHAITKALSVQAAVNLPIPRERIRQVYLGASVPPASDLEPRESVRRSLGLDDRFAVGVVGRISEYKGQHLLVDAIWQLRDRGVEVQGLIAGHAMEPEYLEALKSRVREAGLETQVKFVGFLKEPHSVIGALDVLALTTVKETFGLVLVEAMLLGIPVIGSNAGGVPEIIEHGKTGLLFESENSAALAETIEKLACDQSLRLRLVATAQERGRRNFDRDIQNAQLLGLM